MTAQLAPAGAVGFDCNAVLSAQVARLMKDAKFDFACRYIPREEPHHADLSPGELYALGSVGLAVMAVQHVESEVSWQPSIDKGHSYGAMAATAVMALGIQGTSVWCDLEGVEPGTDPAIVAQYCRAWWTEVSAIAKPGLYVGWNCGLSPEQLWQLPFDQYWAAYNLNADQLPASRGVCMRQHAVLPSDQVAGSGLVIDRDEIQADHLGGLPTWWAAG